VPAPKTSKTVRPISVQNKPAPVEDVKSIYSAAELGVFQTPLIKLRDQINRRIHTMANDSLKNVDDTPSEDRTDDFDREFALNLVSSEHDVLFEIDDALRRIHLKSYGKCDGCSKRIEKIRLRALPFARMCVKCQSESERGRSRFRPFGETLSQGVESATEPAEVEETE
jgi:DnaK suppressor protein